MSKTIGRRMVDIGQKARGRMALRYELEVIPYLCGDIPEGVTHCSFAWERGSKLFVTEAEAVNPNTHAVFWKQYLRQSATIYKEGTELLPKDFAFKVQSVKSGAKAGEEKRKTVGKVHVNLAQFCSEALDAQPQEMLLHLRPCGKLKVSIKATWLRNATVDMDSMTEATAPSLYAESQYNDEEDEEAGPHVEQDLTGFDPETGLPLSGRHHRHGAAASTSGAGEEYDEEGNPIRRKSRKHRRRRRMQTYDGDDIPEDGEAAHGGGYEGEEVAEPQDYGDPGGGSSQADGERRARGSRGGEDGGGGGRRGKAGSQASKGEGRPRLQVYGARNGASGGAEDAGGAGNGPGGVQIEAGRQVHRQTWRDYLCCCLPRQGMAEDPLEGDSLLTKGKLAVANGNTAGGRGRSHQ